VTSVARYGASLSATVASDRVHGVPSQRHPNHRPLASLPPELQRTNVPPHVRAWARQQAGAEVSRVRRLAGASSTAVHRLDLSDGRSMVLRRYVWPGFLASEPEAAQREVDALGFARAHGVPVPRLIAADIDGSQVGDGIPVILTAFVPGLPRAVPDLRALASVAASVHAVDASSFAHLYYPWYEGTLDAAPVGAIDPALWERAIEIWNNRMPAYRLGLLHRDFHPGNVLWSTSGPFVVDWANSCAGPWGCDIAHCRDNLVQLGGVEAADAFLRAYLELTGAEYDPFWEIASVLEHSTFTAERIAWSEPRLRLVVASYGP
jgi:Ser/Thr protein kinase RdoA (MazF antagonist)